MVELTISFCKYDIVISDTLGCALFVAPYDITRASWETKKEWLYIEDVHRRICVRDINFLTAPPPFYIVFCWFFSLLPPPSQVIYFSNGPYKDTKYCDGWYFVCVWWYEWTVDWQSRGIILDLVPDVLAMTLYFLNIYISV